jgi:hypothetical protein
VAQQFSEKKKKKNEKARRTQVRSRAQGSFYSKKKIVLAKIPRKKIMCSSCIPAMVGS